MGQPWVRSCAMITENNIVADGWAGASNPHPHPNPYSTRKHTQKVPKTLPMDGPTDGPTDGRTDKASYRVACPQLKIVLIEKVIQTNKNIISL